MNYLFDIIVFLVGSGFLAASLFVPAAVGESVPLRIISFFIGVLFTLVSLGSRVDKKSCTLKSES